jgi:YtcA family
VRTKQRRGSLLCAIPRACIALAGTTLAAGCQRAPTFNIFGSFFPAWLLCMCMGIVLAVASNRVLIYFKLEQQIMWSVVVYPCMALFFACLLWLIFFS